MRAIVSFPDGREIFCARNARKHLKGSGWKSRLLENSVAEQFRYHVSTSNADHMDNYELTIHLAEGDRSGFRVAERSGDYNEPVRVSIGEIAPGGRQARYFWLIGCKILAHGPGNGREPNKFNELVGQDPPVGEANFYTRWGQKNSLSGTTPLGNGIRMICGGSTAIRRSNTLLAPVFRLIKEGFMLSDAFVLGLLNENQTPICATQSEWDRVKNPLYDCSWQSDPNTGGDFIFIQYPIRVNRLPGWAQATNSQQPSHAPEPLPDGYDPCEFPVLVVKSDDQSMAMFSSRTEKLRNDGVIKANYASGSTLVLYDMVGSAKPSEVAYLASLASLAARGFVSVGRSRLKGDWNQTRAVIQQMDSFPVAQLPSPDTPFDRRLIRSEVKCKYLISKPRFKDGKGAVYEVLDPDLCAILRYEPASQEEDLENFSTSGLRLLLRGWRFEEEQIVRLVGARTAKALAWAVIEQSERERIGAFDEEKAKIAIGYRLYKGKGEAPGRLVPHYVVSFQYREGSGENSPGVVVEIPAAVEGAF